MQKPDDVPEDVWETAKGVLDGYLYSAMSPDEAIARAILAERERCAKMADDFARRVIPASHSNYVHDLAKAIRGGTHD